jgi:hypothetical protein
VANQPSVQQLRVAHQTKPKKEIKKASLSAIHHSKY